MIGTAALRLVLTRTSKRDSRPHSLRSELAIDLYNLSPDGSNWYYLSGSTWTLAGGTASTATSAANLASNLSTFATQLGAGTVYFKIFLQSSGTSACVIDNLAVGGTQ